MVPIPTLEAGNVPLGRWACTVEEVENMYVQPGTREDLWSDWTTLTGALRALVGTVPAAWLSGSFISEKEHPGDIDCLYVIDTDDVLRVMNGGGLDASLLTSMARGQVKHTLGLNVDSYILEWCPTPGPRADAPDSYYLTRGYWDDFWGRLRNSDPRLESLPRRGYLEVVIDGYR